LSWPTVLRSAGSCLLRLLVSTVSPSTMVIAPTPARHRNSAAGQQERRGMARSTGVRKCGQLLVLVVGGIHIVTVDVSHFCHPQPVPVWPPHLHSSPRLHMTVQGGGEQLSCLPQNTLPYMCEQHKGVMHTLQHLGGVGGRTLLAASWWWVVLIVPPSSIGRSPTCHTTSTCSAAARKRHAR
jgi:hypothetical protein